MPRNYAYEPRPAYGRGRPKHKWNKLYASLEAHRGGEVEGMCPSNIPAETVLELLNNGVEHFVGGGGEHPKNIFNVHEGVPYKAHVTRYGRSYHAFPCRKRDIPPRIWRPLLALAAQRNCKHELEKWFNDHS